MQENLKNIRVSNYNYSLPQEKIAKYPLNRRDNSKLLIRKNREISKDQFKNIVHYLPEDSLLVFNNTRVIHARLLFQKESGALIEIFCLEPMHPRDYQISFEQTESVVWRCIVGNAKKWKRGALIKRVEIDEQNIEIKAEIITKSEKGFEIKFEWSGGNSFSEIIEHAGVIPLPPYLNRQAEKDDELSYQTIYAAHDGSVAAPTAGLHFTDKVMEDLKKSRIEMEEITLHVGAGTFKPVKTDSITDHAMHNERVIISASTIEKLLNYKDKIIAVGTTSVRTLESIYQIGVQLENNKITDGDLLVRQWDPYSDNLSLTFEKSLGNILKYLSNNSLNHLRFSTEMIIVPGYDFKIVRGMITNFHQPQSTLLFLIAAFLGDDWQKVYKYALDNDFRFLSYGDSNLYLR